METFTHNATIGTTKKIGKIAFKTLNLQENKTVLLPTVFNLFLVDKTVIITLCSHSCLLMILPLFKQLKDTSKRHLNYKR